VHSGVRPLAGACGNRRRHSRKGPRRGLHTDPGRASDRRRPAPGPVPVSGRGGRSRPASVAPPRHTNLVRPDRGVGGQLDPVRRECAGKVPGKRRTSIPSAESRAPLGRAAKPFSAAVRPLCAFVPKRTCRNNKGRSRISHRRAGLMTSGVTGSQWFLTCLQLGARKISGNSAMEQRPPDPWAAQVADAPERFARLNVTRTNYRELEEEMSRGYTPGCQCVIGMEVIRQCAGISRPCSISILP
jgi:hypothetical protein